jgi:hypothetical protein
MGLTNSDSKSQTDNYSAQTTTTGATASASPTINAGGQVTYNDAGGDVSKQALTTVGSTINSVSAIVQAALDQQNNLNEAALTLLGGMSGQQADAQARAADSSTQLLSQILASNQTLAENTSSGGATLASKYSTQIVWGALALLALVFGSFFFKKKAA